MRIIGSNPVKICDLEYGFTLWTWVNPRGVKYCGVLLPNGHIRQSMQIEYIDEVVECFRERVKMGIYKDCH